MSESSAIQVLCESFLSLMKALPKAANVSSGAGKWRSIPLTTTGHQQFLGKSSKSITGSLRVFVTSEQSEPLTVGEVLVEGEASHTHAREWTVPLCEGTRCASDRRGQYRTLHRVNVKLWDLPLSETRYLTEQEVGLDHLKRVAHDLLGPEPIPWYFSYRVRMGVK